MIGGCLVGRRDRDNGRIRGHCSGNDQRSTYIRVVRKAAQVAAPDGGHRFLRNAVGVAAAGEPQSVRRTKVRPAIVEGTWDL